jgi:hypothetical protein
MNHDRLAELGRLFDGELDEAAADALRASIEDDPEGRAYLERIGRLRALARAHDPAVPPGVTRPRRPRARRILRSAPAIAATLLVLLGFPTDPPGRRAPEPAPATRVAQVASRPTPPAWIGPADPLEVDLHVWANTPSRRPEQAARLVLARAAGPRPRLAAREVLALELANATPGAAGRVRDVTSPRATPARPSVPPRRPSSAAPRT